MPRDINTLLRKDALMKVDKRSEKYVQPSRRRRRRRRRGDGDDAGLAHRAAREEERGEGGVHALRTCPHGLVTIAVGGGGRGRGRGRGRGGCVARWRNSPDAICINEPPDNGARSMNYVPRGSNPNETRIAFDSSPAPRAPRTPSRLAATVHRRVVARHSARFARENGGKN